MENDDPEAAQFKNKKLNKQNEENESDVLERITFEEDEKSSSSCYSENVIQESSESNSEKEITKTKHKGKYSVLRFGCCF